MSRTAAAAALDAAAKEIERRRQRESTMAVTEKRDTDDLTGRDRFGRNIGAAWIGQAVVVISGFIVPRLIDERLDQASLGVWDFGWSTVSYFRFMGLGVAGSVNRYVARYRAQGDTTLLRRAVSSAGFLQVALAALTMLVALLVGYLTPRIFRPEAGELVHAARWMVILLGASLCVSMLCSPARGVLTGYHRWALNTAITATGDIFIMLGLIVVLLSDGGLIGLGAAYLTVSTCVELTRVIAARRVYGERLLTWSARDRSTLYKMFVFGMKNNVNSAPHLVVVQTVSIVLASAAGPATLALLARPMALARLVQTLLISSVTVLVPTFGSLQGLGKQDEIKKLFLMATRISYAFTIPSFLTLALYGDVVVRLWMGDAYVNPVLNATIAAGVFLPYSVFAAGSMLRGLNMHGKVGIRSLTLSLVTLVSGLTLVSALGWTPVSAALVIGASLTFGPGLVIPISACNRLGLSLLDYLREVSRPLLCNLGFVAAVGVPRLVLEDVSFPAAVLILAAGAALLALLYWRWVLDGQAKSAITRRLSFLPG